MEYNQPLRKSTWIYSIRYEYDWCGKTGADLEDNRVNNDY